jgi:hypothetical protein
MAVFKCKMCGGALEIGENQSVATCEYCGTQQTLPKLDNEKKLALFSRANNLRIKSEFDKAAGIYESIIAEFRDEAEAYWGLVLCKYGIEYVDDGKGKRIPTCHRTLPISVMEDDDFQQACEYAEITAKNIYREEAKAIDKIQKKILDIAVNEDPYDIFICYKETDDVTGSRTEDSSIAQDIYTHLLKDGYRVFYSRVSLREVAGTEYEPYIYAALSSAKIMLAIGTKHDYYDAVWVKNEWSRFISMMSDDSGKVLIPCFRDMDAYDMPKEFKNMQALDMGDVTFFGSLMENIERIVDKTRVKAVKETIVLNNDTGDIAPLLERGFMFLEDKDWGKADEFFEAVLNKDPKNGNAYLGKLLADLEISKFENLSDFYTSFSGNNNYEKIMRFGNSELKESIKKANDIIVHRNEEARKKDIYDKALQMMVNATTEEMFENAGYMFQEVKDFLDAKEKSDECFEKGEEARIRAEEEEFTKIYDSACYVVTSEHTWSNKLNDLSQAVAQLEKLNGWRDSEEKAVQGRAKIEEIKAKLEEERIVQERKAELARKEEDRRQRRNLNIAIVVIAVTLAGMIFFSVLNTAIIPNVKYNNAMELMEAGEYLKAIDTFESLNGYKDSSNKIEECNIAILNGKYNDAIAWVEEGKYIEAYDAFIALEGYKDSAELADSIYSEYKVEKLRNAQVGDYIMFGTYEQDNNTSNGSEEIEWLVLDVQDGKALVISKYALDCKPYNFEDKAVVWETCTLRKWLNEDFINTSFSVDEKSMIPTVTVNADENTEYNTVSGNDTQDKVFLLSIDEARGYFGSDSDRLCEFTDYAYAKLNYGSKDNCWCWLRSPGGYQYYAAVVGSSGGVSGMGYIVSNEYTAVRPAMWISIDSIEK